MKKHYLMIFEFQLILSLIVEYLQIQDKLKVVLLYISIKHHVIPVHPCFVSNLYLHKQKIYGEFIVLELFLQNVIDHANSQTTL